MHLSRIVIKNFRSLGDIDVDHLPPSAVFLGENGAGKSNLLSALRLVLDDSLQPADRRLVAEDFWDGLEKPFAGAQVEVAAEVTGYENDDDALAVLTDCLVDDEPITARLTYLYRPRPSVPAAELPQSGPSDYEWIIFGGDDETNTAIGDVRKYIGLKVLPALRDADSEMRSWRRTSPLRQLLESLSLPEEVLDGVVQSMSDAKNSLLEQKDVSDLDAAIRDKLEAVAGNLFSVATELGMAALSNDQVLPSIRLLLSGPGNTTRGLSAAGLGTANVIYLTLLLNLISQRKELGEIVATVLGVEEPEAHVHPHLQRVLFSYLVREETPLIVTTHSPHIASVTPLLALVLVRRGNAGSTCTKLDPNVLDQMLVDDLQRYLDVTRAEILFAQGVILVEGSAERFIVPAIAAELGYDLDRLGITVASVEGTDFNPYVTLLGQTGYQIDHVVVTDGDPKIDSVDRGVKRACLLAGEPTASEALAAATAGDGAAARQMLQESGLFVGEATLELDLLGHAGAAAFKTAYAELVAGNVAQANFNEKCDEFVAGDITSGEGVLSRIDSVGKGRFAQRLVAHLGGHGYPAYLVAAVEAIVAAVVDAGGDA